MLIDEAEYEKKLIIQVMTDVEAHRKLDYIVEVVLIVVCDLLLVYFHLEFM